MDAVSQFEQFVFGKSFHNDDIAIRHKWRNCKYYETKDFKKHFGFHNKILLPGVFIDDMAVWILRDKLD